MSSYDNTQEFSAPVDLFAAAAAADERAGFIVKTYLYLTGAIFVFAAIEAVLLNLPGIEGLVALMIGNKISWLIVLGLFIGTSHIANSWAQGATSSTMQHAGLALYVVAQSIIFLPLLYIAQMVGGPGTITSAAGATLGLFGIMTIVVFLTRQDFSFLRAFLMFGGFAALGFIIVSILFGFTLGPIFIYAMIAFACCYILYDTSNILHHYRIGQHVAASLALFASVALLFWYILQLFLSRNE
jgi:FtsH-binding integral membrane protein